MSIICPTVLAVEPHEFREQMERIQGFAERIQIDLMDGEFTTSKSVELSQIWWPKEIKVDLHLMYETPYEHIDLLKELNPNIVIVHAEADGNFVEFAHELHASGIKVGVALLQHTPVSVIAPAAKHIDHVLIFSGNLGHFGGEADLGLLRKVAEIRALKEDIEIGWDGGINDKNALALAHEGVDVLNIGGFIQKADEPKQAYATLKLLVGTEGE
ncbi:MAG: rpe, Ribulose-phosphate 3-epimerase [Candidatus Saccharibacteria bacterium]|nr:rpe, Ribulose-phosphate 3-epimerase [Candidatus Saccharibacteria bacterium]